MNKPMKHILIVDDEKLILYSLSAALQSNDTEIITSQDGRGALKALGDWSFDFCCLDMHLPDMSGLDIMRTIRRISPLSKIIMMTGSEVDESAMKAIRENAYLFLTKPFDLFRVKRVLNAVSDKDENVFQEFTELEKRLAAERRQHRRQAVTKHIAYVTAAAGSEEKKRYFKADMLDISDNGTCIRTSCRLEPGSMVRFRNSVNSAAGIVRWSATDEQNALYMAGIQFIGLDRT